MKCRGESVAKVQILTKDGLGELLCLAKRNNVRRTRTGRRGDRIVGDEPVAGHFYLPLVFEVAVETKDALLHALHGNALAVFCKRWQVTRCSPQRAKKEENIASLKS